MDIYKMPVTFFALTVVIAMSCSASRADDLPLMGFARVYKAEGPYEYNRDGVPVLGFVTDHLNDNRVKFTTCNSVTMEVAFQQLKSSAARCPGSKKAPGPWAWASGTVSPIIKTGSGPATVMVKFEDKNIDLDKLPDLYRDYKQLVSKAKTGDWVGYAFVGDDGKKSLGILTPPSQ